jgi:DNA-binding XRE family transcriptional regulator
MCEAPSLASQAGLCRIARISPQTWNNAETGDNLIGIGNAIKLCRATGITLGWIYPPLIAE